MGKGGGRGIFMRYFSEAIDLFFGHKMSNEKVKNDGWGKWR